MNVLSQFYATSPQHRRNRCAAKLPQMKQGISSSHHDHSLLVKESKSATIHCVASNGCNTPIDDADKTIKFTCSSRSCHEEYDTSGFSSPVEPDEPDSYYTQEEEDAYCHPVDATVGTIEIAPGEYRAVLSAATSRRAMTTDTFVVAMCWPCNTTILTVPDTAYVLCPICRTVNPTEHDASDPQQEEVVGLGFTVDSLESQY